MTAGDLTIPQLTDELRATFPAHVDEWTAIGRSTEPMDRVGAARGITAAYGAAGLPAPRLFFALSPVGGALMRELIRAGRLALVDPLAAPGRWQVTRPSIVAYLSPAPPAPMRVLSGAPRPWSDAGGGADTPAGAA